MNMWTRGAVCCRCIVIDAVQDRASSFGKLSLQNSRRCCQTCPRRVISIIKKFNVIHRLLCYFLFWTVYLIWIWSFVNLHVCSVTARHLSSDKKGVFSIISNVGWCFGIVRSIPHLHGSYEDHLLLVHFVHSHSYSTVTTLKNCLSFSLLNKEGNKCCISVLKIEHIWLFPISL